MNDQTMQEWNVQSGARKSTVSEKPFTDGDQVRSLLCIDAEGVLQRLDLAADDNWNSNGVKVLAQWVRVFRQDTTGKDQEKVALQSKEEVFLQMVQSQEALDTTEENMDRLALIYLMALYLERKRILRALGQPDENKIQAYRHVGRKEEFSIQTTSIEPEALLRMTDQLEKIF